MTGIGRLGFGRDAAVAEPPAEQVTGVGGRQHVEVQRVRAVGRDQGR